jgi:Helicase conserved C-terminal domain
MSWRVLFQAVLLAYRCSHTLNSCSLYILILRVQANLEKFRRGRVQLLLVTDVAARGIDVPLLNNVVNYSFPPLPKLFVHR